MGRIKYEYCSMTGELWLRESNNGGLSEMQGSGGAYYYYLTTTILEQEAEGGPNDVPDAHTLKNPPGSLREFKRAPRVRISCGAGLANSRLNCLAKQGSAQASTHHPLLYHVLRTK